MSLRSSNLATYPVARNTPRNKLNKIIQMMDCLPLSSCSLATQIDEELDCRLAHRSNSQFHLYNFVICDLAWDFRALDSWARIYATINVRRKLLSNDFIYKDYSQYHHFFMLYLFSRNKFRIYRSSWKQHATSFINDVLK